MKLKQTKKKLLVTIQVELEADGLHEIEHILDELRCSTDAIVVDMEVVGGND